MNYSLMCLFNSFKNHSYIVHVHFLFNFVVFIKIFQLNSVFFIHFTLIFYPIIEILLLFFVKQEKIILIIIASKLYTGYYLIFLYLGLDFLNLFDY